MAIIKNLKNILRQVVYPRTVERAVYDDDGVRLDNKLNTLATKEDLTQLSNENTDIKMLGWSVPKELGVGNYIDADRKFHQRVGRVSLAEARERSYLSTQRLFTLYIDGLKLGDDARHCMSKYYTFDPNLYPSSTDKVYSPNSGQNYIYIRDNASNGDFATFKNRNKEIYFYYELATEIVTPMDGHEAINMLSDAHSSSKTYYNGDLVIYNNELWKYDKVGASGTNAIPTDTIASRTSLGEEIKGINRDLAEIAEWKYVGAINPYTETLNTDSAYLAYCYGGQGLAKYTAAWLIITGGGLARPFQIYGDSTSPTLSFNGLAMTITASTTLVMGTIRLASHRI